MNFLIDAQLPRRMVAWLMVAGADAVHTLDLPDGNRTTDVQVNDPNVGDEVVEETTTTTTTRRTP